LDEENTELLGSLEACKA